VTTRGSTEDRGVRSILADLPGSDPARVVIVGAHADSTMDGPGINDNGSGIAALLALAEGFAGSRPLAAVRVAFWAAEEPGLRGSSRYVERLAADERDRIVAYLNVDMLGSPNGIRGIYDEAGAPPGSETIRDLLAADLEAHGLAWEGVDQGGGADHTPFQIALVPTGGLFSGANEFITRAQADRYGRIEGRMADPCYHLACDDRANVDLALLTEMASSLARVIAKLALDG